MAPSDPSSSSPAVAGHVSMMNDVLISQLPPDLLRSTLRTLLASSHANAALFSSTIRNHVTANPPHAPNPSILLSDPSDTTALDQLLVDARICFASHRLTPALYLLSLVPDAIVKSKPHLVVGQGFYPKLVQADGDMLQAAQALKESGDRSHGTQKILERLISVLYHARDDCQDADAPYPFTRALVQLVDAAHGLFPDNPGLSVFPLPQQTVMFSPKRPAKRLPQVKLGKLEVPRLFFGLWQLSSSAWGAASQEQCEDALSQLLSHGFTAADMADHYADAELLFGRFRSRLTFPDQREPTIGATKYCQFAPIPADQVIDRDWALERVLERSRRIGGTVDLLQVHWQHLDDERYLDVFAHLVDIAATQPELVTAIGLCNFDAETTAKICEHLLAVRGEVGIVSNQVQYSLVDQRPRFAMAKVCEKYGIKLLTYGTFCGGFLSSKWVGRPEPSIYAGDLNTSQRKYYDMIRAWGGWDLFQSLLRVLQAIADKYHVDVSNVAARWVLDQPETGVVIIGSRLGVSEHIESSLQTFDFELIDEDRAEIENVLVKSRAKDMFEQIGDCGSEYR